MMKTAFRTPQTKDNLVDDAESDELGDLSDEYTPCAGRAAYATRPQAKRKLNLGKQTRDGFKTPHGRRKRQPSVSSPYGRSPDCSRNRYDTSLGLLTKRFVTMMHASPDKVIDLNAASEKLTVQKRRIYDITNVLEGVGLIKKRTKNNVQWVGHEGEQNENDATSAAAECSRKFTLESELNKMNTREEELDTLIKQSQETLKKLTEDSLNSRLAFVTYNDIRSIQSLSDQQVMAIKAPAETMLEVPEPDEEIQIYLKSTNGPIDVFLCPDNPDDSEARLLTDADPDTPHNSITQDSPSAYSDTLADLALVQEALEANSKTTESNPPTPAKIATLVQSLQSGSDRKGFNSFGHMSPGTCNRSIPGSPMTHDLFGMSQPMLSSDLPSSGSYNSDELSFIQLEPLNSTDCLFSLDEREGISDLFDIEN